MKTRTNLKAGQITLNHNEKLTAHKAKGYPVKTQLKAGQKGFNHNESLVRHAADLFHHPVSDAKKPRHRCVQGTPTQQESFTPLSLSAEQLN